MGWVTGYQCIQFVPVHHTVTTLIIENGYCLFSPISSADLFISLKGLLVQYNCMIHRVSPSGESPKIRILKFGAVSIIKVRNSSTLAGPNYRELPNYNTLWEPRI